MQRRLLIPFPLSSLGWPQWLLSSSPLAIALVSVLGALVPLDFYFCSFIAESGQSAWTQYRLYQVLTVWSQARNLTSL